jgi:hypothetical protein
VFGLLVGRWWSLLLPPAVALIVFADARANWEGAGDDTSGLVFLWVPPVEIAVVIGVLLRKVASGWNEAGPPSTHVK